MLFFLRRELYRGGLAGFNSARHILRDNGIFFEEREVHCPGGFSPEVRARMESIGQTYERDMLCCLYVSRRELKRARELIGNGAQASAKK